MNTVAEQTVSSGASNRALITISVMLASILQTLDNTIANVVLPHIQGSLSATQEQTGWVLTSYIVAAAVATPLAGWIAGPLGRRKVFTGSIAAFTIASALCGISQTLSQLVLFRVIQGVAGAALVPLSQAVLLDIYPREQHGRATAMWAMGITIGPILGPVLGGWLTEIHSWRWVFFINLPFGILAMFGVMSFVPESRSKFSPFDFFGFAMLSLAIGGLQIMLDRGQLLDWFSSTEIIAEMVVVGLASYLFLVHSLTSRQPFVSLSLFADRNFSIGCVLMFVLSISPTLTLTPPLLQNLMHYPVITTGLVTAPRGIGIITSMMTVGRLIGYVDARILIAAGLGVTAFSIRGMTGFSPQMNSWPVVWTSFLQGAGMGFMYVPLASAAFATLRPDLRNEGTSMFSLIRNIGSSIGIAVFMALLTRNTQIMHARLGEYVTPYDASTRSYFGFGDVSTSGLHSLNVLVSQQAQMIAYNNDFQLLFVLLLISTPLVLLLKVVKPGAGAPSNAVKRRWRSASGT
jgi:DHA2 family multidrug resistance protein